MRVKLREIIKEILSHYGELYNAALTKMVFLVDWEAAKRWGCSVSGLKWKRQNHGPFLWDVLNCAKAYPELFEIVEAGEKRLVRLKDWTPANVSPQVRKLIQEIVAKIPDPRTDFKVFVEYVYQTDPMRLTLSPYERIDLVEVAKALKDVEETEIELSTPEWKEALSYLAAH